MRLAARLLCLELLAGCSPVDAMLRGGSTSYAWGRITSSHTNIHGQRDFNRDAYQCKRENSSGHGVDYGMALECLTSLGWRIPE